MGILSTICEICNRKKLWFLIKQRELKPNESLPLIKSDKKMCEDCYKKSKKYFVK